MKCTSTKFQSVISKNYMYLKVEASKTIMEKRGSIWRKLWECLFLSDMHNLKSGLMNFRVPPEINTQTQNTQAQNTQSQSPKIHYKTGACKITSDSRR